ncbi:MAG: hemolysin III family protein [Candidatus Pacebacteria bacterium]|jgi:channel protein (hemolysin III family)|nr:hemolysin III family protein [Candidatus Paceibacterota bacterium]
MLRYDESSTKPWWYPRHPGVVVLDVLGVAMSTWWLSQSSHWTTDVYLVTFVLLYGVSGLYHHYYDRSWLAKLDHIMIFYIIAITALPYWGHIIPWDWYPGGLLLIVIICLLGTVVKLVSFLPRVVSALAYLAAAAPMVLYFIFSYNEIPTLQYWLWLVGIALYSLQLAVYTRMRPDPYPGQCGYREIQHIVLLAATNLHSSIALSLA